MPLLGLTRPLNATRAPFVTVAFAACACGGITSLILAPLDCILISVPSCTFDSERAINLMSLIMLRGVE